MRTTSSCKGGQAGVTDADAVATLKAEISAFQVANDALEGRIKARDAHEKRLKAWCRRPMRASSCCSASWCSRTRRPSTSSRGPRASVLVACSRDPPQRRSRSSRCSCSRRSTCSRRVSRSHSAGHQPMARSSRRPCRGRTPPKTRAAAASAATRCGASRRCCTRGRRGRARFQLGGSSPPFPRKRWAMVGCHHPSACPSCLCTRKAAARARSNRRRRRRPR